MNPSGDDLTNTSTPEREAFEAWWWREMLNCHERFKYLLERDANDCYVGTNEQAGWFTWQARAALASSPAQKPTEKQIGAWLDEARGKIYGTLPQVLYVVEKALAASPAVPSLTDEQIAALGEEHGLCTIVENAGYRANALWFDGPKFDFARAVLALAALPQTEPSLTDEQKALRAVLAWARGSVRTNSRDLDDWRDDMHEIIRRAERAIADDREAVQQEIDVAAPQTEPGAEQS